MENNQNRNGGGLEMGLLKGVKNWFSGNDSNQEPNLSRRYFIKGAGTLGATAIVAPTLLVPNQVEAGQIPRYMLFETVDEFLKDGVKNAPTSAQRGFCQFAEKGTFDGCLLEMNQPTFYDDPLYAATAAAVVGYLDKNPSRVTKMSKQFDGTMGDYMKVSRIGLEKKNGKVNKVFPISYQHFFS